MVDAMVHALKWLQTAGPSDIIKTVPESYFLGDRALYLAAFTLLVLPIALAGLRSAPPATVHPDSFVLWLPASRGDEALALLAYIGGFSAATGMVIVASVALATMISNA